MHALTILSLCDWLNLAISGKLHLATPPFHSARKGKINSEFKHYQFLKGHISIETVTLTNLIAKG
jgi:hypothetical protein